MSTPQVWDDGGVTDPIASPNFNLYRPRPANPARIERIRELAEAYWARLSEMETARQELAEEIRAAKESGHSYSQLMEASGLSLSAIQRMVE